MAKIVDATRERSRVRELDSLNSQMQWWRWGTTIVITLFLIGCLIELNSSVHGLINPGPIQDEFVQDVNTSLQTDTVPTLEHEATETLTEIQPEVQTSVLKLKGRVPELAQAAEDQVHILQTDLPAKSEAILNKRFALLISSRESKIRSMYPEVTPDQLRLLVTNLSTHVQAQITSSSNDLFSAHEAKLQSILASMNTIKSQEAGNVKNEQPDWEMGVLLLDVFRDDLQSLSTQQKKSGSESKKVVLLQTTTDRRGRI
jgi:hypothetical protein